MWIMRNKYEVLRYKVVFRATIRISAELHAIGSLKSWEVCGSLLRLSWAECGIGHPSVGLELLLAEKSKSLGLRLTIIMPDVFIRELFVRVNERIPVR